MLFALLGYAERELNSKLQITVATSSSLNLDNLKGVISHCSPQLLKMVRFILLPAMSKSWFSDALRDDVADGYDYIEYNGGMSFDTNYMVQLQDLSSVIVIFYTLIF